MGSKWSLGSPPLPFLNGRPYRTDAEHDLLDLPSTASFLSNSHTHTHSLSQTSSATHSLTFPSHISANTRFSLPHSFHQPRLPLTRSHTLAHAHSRLCVLVTTHPPHHDDEGGRQQKSEQNKWNGFSDLVTTKRNETRRFRSQSGSVKIGFVNSVRPDDLT